MSKAFDQHAQERDAGRQPFKDGGKQSLVQRADPHLAAIRAVGKGLLKHMQGPEDSQDLQNLSHEIEEARFGLYKAMANYDQPASDKPRWLRGACGWVNALEALSLRVPAERGQENIRDAVKQIKAIVLIAVAEGKVSP